MFKQLKEDLWYHLCLYISSGKEPINPSDDGLKQLSTGPDTVHICALHQETAPKNHVFEVCVVLTLLLAMFFFCKIPDLSFSRLFVELRLENRHFVIVLSHCSSSPSKCWCLPYALITFPSGQTADVGFKNCFPNTLFVLNCDLFNVTVEMPGNKLNQDIIHE